MVNIYNKGGFKNPSIPKPSGGYSSLVKPATAPMRQGGLSQLAAKAAVQGRQPAAGNPPIPQTGRMPAPPPARPVESVPPSDTPAPTPTPHYGMITPRTEPSVPRTQGGMLGAITQGLRAPQGQARGMVGAAAEAVGTQGPGWLAAASQGLSLLGGASKPGDEMPFVEPSHGDPGNTGYYASTEVAPETVMAHGPSAAEEAEYDKKMQRDELVAGGMDPMMADLVMQLVSGEYGLSEEEKAKIIAEGAGQQAEMMAARGLGASGLAGTGFGDIYSQVHADDALLSAEQKGERQQLLANILGAQDVKKALSKEAQSAQLLGWATELDDEITSVNPQTNENYDKWVALGLTDSEIKAKGIKFKGKYFIPAPPASDEELSKREPGWWKKMDKEQLDEWGVTVFAKYGNPFSGEGMPNDQPLNTQAEWDEWWKTVSEGEKIPVEEGGGFYDILFRSWNFKLLGEG